MNQIQLGICYQYEHYWKNYNPYRPDQSRFPSSSITDDLCPGPSAVTRKQAKQNVTTSSAMARRQYWLHTTETAWSFVMCNTINTARRSFPSVLRAMGPINPGPTMPTKSPVSCTCLHTPDGHRQYHRNVRKCNRLFPITTGFAFTDLYCFNKVSIDHVVDPF